jgi:hypothetical protein
MEQEAAAFGSCEAELKSHIDKTRQSLACKSDLLHVLAKDRSDLEARIKT